MLHETLLLPKNEKFYSHLNTLLLMQITRTEKEFVKILKEKILENIVICMFKALHYC